MPVPVSPALDAGTDSDTAPELFALRVHAAFNESRLAIALILPVVALAVMLLWAKVEHWRLLAWGGGSGWCLWRAPAAVRSLRAWGSGPQHVKRAALRGRIECGAGRGRIRLERPLLAGGCPNRR